MQPLSSSAAGPSVFYEEQAGRSMGARVAGVDEVGRGPLAGPVVACAVILPDDLSRLPAGINDSKKLTPRRRALLAAELRASCAFALGEASVEEIDSLNILQATFLAMRRALSALPGAPAAHVLVDGPHIPKSLNIPATPIISGDSKSLSIAAASIIAKVARDEMMEHLDQLFPGYGWASNAGYGSAAHLKALDSLGITPYHRRSFAPVARALQKYHGEIAA